MFFSIFSFSFAKLYFLLQYFNSLANICGIVLTPYSSSGKEKGKLSKRGNREKHLRQNTKDKCRSNMGNMDGSVCEN